MPGVTDVADGLHRGRGPRPHVRPGASTRSGRWTWPGPGPVDGESDDDIVAELKRAELPLAVPAVPLLAKTVETRVHLLLPQQQRAGDQLRDRRRPRRPGRDLVGARSRRSSPRRRSRRSSACRSTRSRSTSSQGGGSFGRKLFFDAALEAAEVSQKMGKPVKLMWHRADDFRPGRVHPMATSRVRATYLGDEVLTYEQRHTSVATDFSHGLGEIITALPRRAAGRRRSASPRRSSR